MNCRRRLLMGLLTAILSVAMLVALAPVVVHAQVPGQPEFDVSKLPGLQGAVNRVYTGDTAALYLGPDGSAPVSGPVFFSVSASVAKFDSTAHAAAALKEIERQYTGNNQSADAFHLKPAEIDRIGDGSFAYTGATKMGQLEATLGIVTARKGRFVYTATGFAMGLDPAPPMADLVRTMAGLKEGGTVKTTGDGLHTGGLWSVLPVDQGLPDGVKANMDLQLYPTPKS